MNRRAVISLLGGAVASWASVARAQQQALPVVGVLDSGSRDDTTQFLAAFRRGLADALRWGGHLHAKCEALFAVIAPWINLCAEQQIADAFLCRKTRGLGRAAAKGGQDRDGQQVDWLAAMGLEIANRPATPRRSRLFAGTRYWRWPLPWRCDLLLLHPRFRRDLVRPDGDRAPSQSRPVAWQGIEPTDG